MSLNLTPLQLIRIMQGLCVMAGLTLMGLMLGPFQGAEQAFGLTDTMAHAIAFYGLSIGLFVCLPHWRRTDLAIFAMAIGLAVEILQGATGRSASAVDLMADGLGVVAATLPGLVERLRHHARSNPYMSFADIGKLDRRARRQQAEGGSVAHTRISTIGQVARPQARSGKPPRKRVPLAR